MPRCFLSCLVYGDGRDLRYSPIGRPTVDSVDRVINGPLGSAFHHVLRVLKFTVFIVCDQKARLTIPKLLKQ